MDLRIKFVRGPTKPKDPDDGDGEGSVVNWAPVYGPHLAKVLARFQPVRSFDRPTGYFVQRSAENLAMFALSTYVVTKLGYYPYIPIFRDGYPEVPRVPRRSEPNNPGASDVVFFQATANKPSAVLNFTLGETRGGECSIS
ncbi:hypothetical protein NX059_006193 [Plenodomus lindquistii]|nr:hypothetical protein NX059_006193 [Plenodomus lindquistii]